MSSRRAVVVGHRGQDGHLLTELLRRRGYDVLGVGRDRTDVWGGVPAPDACRVDRPEAVFRAVDLWRPHEVYYLAAHHGPAEAGEADAYTGYLAELEVNVAGVLHFLEGVRRHSPSTRLFYASSSLVFGNWPDRSPQDETTPVAPEGAYALCKRLAAEACREYRERHGVFASVGILFNHESPLRPPRYLSAKIVRAAAAARGSTGPLMLGDTRAVVDWGYAPDFVEAFTRILALDRPDDFVVATGEGHTVGDFAQAAFGRVGLDWRCYVVEDPGLLVRRGSGRVGDPAKLRRLTGWAPSETFAGMVAALVDDALGAGRAAAAGGAA